MKNLTNYLLWAFICLQISCGALDSGEKSVLIQPYSGFGESHIQKIKSKIEENYGFAVYVAKRKKIPQAAFVNIKSPRYRADSMILFLKRSKPDSIDFVLGLCSQDISTTKKDKKGKMLQPASKYEDWGLFGLGYVPGPSCIVSSYRLGSKPQLLESRLIKVSLHELGHNLGLPHCKSSPKCVMRDAAETIRTVDQVDDELCVKCKSRI